MSLLRVENLCTSFLKPSGTCPASRHETIQAVDQVSFEVQEGSIAGIAGETGCGKTTLARTLLKILRPSSGQIYFHGRPLHRMPERRFRSLRGDLQLVSSNPGESFRPGWNIRRLFFEVLDLHHRELSRREKRDRMDYLLKSVGMDEGCAERFPQSLNLFDRQRVCFARVLAAQPRLLICDDPGRYLDTVSQARILDLLKDIRVHWRVTVLFMARDYAAVSQVSDVLHVMTRGRFVESGAPDHLFHYAQHEHTRQLLALSSAP